MAITTASSPDVTIEKAFELLDRLPELVDRASDMKALARLFQITDLKMLLNFEQVKKTKRVVNQLAGGVVAAGSGRATNPTIPRPDKDVGTCKMPRMRSPQVKGTSHYEM